MFVDDGKVPITNAVPVHNYALGLLLVLLFPFCDRLCARKKNGFVTETKLGTTINFFVAATKNFAAATKRLVDELNILL